MKALILAALLSSSASWAGTAFFQFEEQTGGFTKQCVYNYLGSIYTLTISNVALCPLTLEVPT
jgi:hypothetical protein